MGTSRGSFQVLTAGQGYINAGTHLNFQTDDWSWIGWCNPDSAITANDTILGNNVVYLSVNGSDILKLFGGAELAATTALTNDQWSHYTATSPNGATTTKEIFVNGVSDGSGSLSYSSSTATYYYGSRNTVSLFWEGEMAHNSVYNEVFTVDEIAEVMWKPESRPQNLYQYFPMWDGTPTEYDRSGNGRDGSWNASPTSSSDGPPIFLEGSYT